MKQGYAIAVDLGASNVRAALVAQSGKIIRKAAEPTEKRGRNGGAITEQIIRLIGEISKDARKSSLKGISIASMGPLDYERGGPIRSPNIPYPFVPLLQPLRKEFSLPVRLFNDTNAAVLGEKYFGGGKRIENLVYVTISTGIGGGAIVGGNLLLGKSGNAAEIGHMIVDTTYHIPCTCKKGNGHWEGLASGRNIPRFFQVWSKAKGKSVPAAQTAKEIFQEAKRGNEDVRVFLDELARVNARAISNIIVAYDPALITIGGSVALNNKSAIIGGITKYVDRYLKIPKIEITKLGEDIGLLGAASAVFQK